MRIAFHRAARAETKRAKYWFVDRDPRSPELFQASLDGAIATIAEFPESGQQYLMGTRRMVLESVPYSLVYRVHDRGITILAVAHAKQRPGHWRHR